MAARRGSHVVSCYHCAHRFEVGGKTQSTNCPDCNQRLIVEDVVIKQLTPVKQVNTCGRLVVRAKGSLLAERVHASEGVEVLGSLQAHVTSAGPVHIGPKARWKGDCTAPALSIDAGARIESGAFAVPAPAQRAAVSGPGSTTPSR